MLNRRVHQLSHYTNVMKTDASNIIYKIHSCYSICSFLVIVACTSFVMQIYNKVYEFLACGISYLQNSYECFCGDEHFDRDVVHSHVQVTVHKCVEVKSLSAYTSLHMAVKVETERSSCEQEPALKRDNSRLLLQRMLCFQAI